MSSSPKADLPPKETIKRTKEEWMMRYPMTEEEAQRMVDNPPRRIPDDEDPNHDSPM